MSGNLRSQVLSAFKKLHRTRMNKFKDDDYALEVTRKKINDEYKNHKQVIDEKKIAELNDFAMAVEREVRTTIIQAREVEPGKFEVQITPDTEKLDNAVLDSDGFCTNKQKKSPSFRKCPDSTNTS